MVDFVIENKEVFFVILGVLGFLVESFLSIIGFVIILNKKVQPDVKAFILERLPQLIRDAETLFSSGINKKIWVIDNIRNELEARYPSIKSSVFYSFISKSIENILGTPEKKEVVK